MANIPAFHRQPSVTYRAAVAASGFPTDDRATRADGAPSTSTVSPTPGMPTDPYSKRLRAASRGLWDWERQLHEMADLTLAPSQSAVDDPIAHGVPRVAPWGRGVDTVRFHPSRRNLPAPAHCVTSCRPAAT